MMRKLLFASVCLLFIVCGSGDGPVGLGDGDATETGNTFVQGTVVNSQGLPVADVPVVLYKTSFNPVEETVPDSLKDTTDAGGVYVFVSVPPGTYNVLARRPGHDAVMFVPALNTAADGSCLVAEDTLRRGYSVVVELDSAEAGAGRYLFVPGTDIFTRLDSGVVDCRAVLRSMPAADFLDIRHLGPDEPDSLLFSGLNTAAGADTVHCPGPWCKRPSLH